ncbi:MAG: hypothetical protein ACR2RE_05180 [Geminicoccaceae bacterium]
MPFLDDLISDISGGDLLEGAISIGGALIGAGAAGEAAGAQAQASDEATQTILDMFNQTRQDLAPWRLTGTGALTELGYLYGIAPFGAQASPEDMQAARDRFMETPGYEFRFGEGLRALDRSASARGRLMSGGHERALQRYGQGIATAEFGDYANRLASLAGIGQTATTATGAFGASAAGGAAGAMQDAGTARASGYVGQAGAWQEALENLGGIFGGTGRSTGAINWTGPRIGGI